MGGNLCNRSRVDVPSGLMWLDGQGISPFDPHRISSGRHAVVGARRVGGCMGHLAPVAESPSAMSTVCQRSKFKLCHSASHRRVVGTLLRRTGGKTGARVDVLGGRGQREGGRGSTVFAGCSHGSLTCAETARSFEALSHATVRDCTSCRAWSNLRRNRDVVTGERPHTPCSQDQAFSWLCFPLSQTCSLGCLGM